MGAPEVPSRNVRHEQAHVSGARKRANVSTIGGKRRVRSRPEKENPAQARGKSQVRRMSGRLGDWGNLKAVQPALVG
jgi:hypothetical protein